MSYPLSRNTYMSNTIPLSFLTVVFQLYGRLPSSISLVPLSLGLLYAIFPFLTSSNHVNVSLENPAPFSASTLNKTSIAGYGIHNQADQFQSVTIVFLFFFIRQIRSLPTIQYRKAPCSQGSAQSLPDDEASRNPLENHFPR